MFVLGLTVIPRSSINKFVQEAQGLKLKITAPPVDGEANKKIIEYLAKTFSCSKSAIQLRTGEKSKHKVFVFYTLTMEQGQQQLMQILRKEDKNVSN